MVLTEPCEPWAGAMEKTGYGRRKVAGKMWMAHRYAYFVEHGEIPEGLVIDHLCFNRACVEVSHLRALSREENSGRHKPSCSCSICRPEDWRRASCVRGHDTSAPSSRGKSGQCKECKRDDVREYMRRRRAAERSLASAEGVVRV